MKPGMIDHKIFVGTISLMLLALANAGNVRAAAVPTNTLSFSESLNDRVVCIKDPDAGLSCDQLIKDSLGITAKILLNGVPIANFDENTSFELSVGSFSVTHVLADDPTYKTNKTHATFVDKDTFTDNNGNDHMRVYQTVHLKWNARQLTVIITGRTPDTSSSSLTPIQADSFDGNDSGSISNSVSGSINFDTATVTFDTVTFTGRVKTRNVTAKDGSSLMPSIVTIKGRGLGSEGP